MQDEPDEKKWRPINRELRRVIGVLVEKAKTTPDSYPLTLNSITTASNQKSNRNPQMQLSLDEVEDALYDLREIGAVVEIQGDGRKFKYKHLLYEWLGVDKVQLAIMAELLLRGQQTIGELRARAARMEKIDGLAELVPMLDELIRKQLVISLTPPGRGQIVTHGLYLPEELAKIERQLLGEGLIKPPTDSDESKGLLPESDEMVARDLLSELNGKIDALSERVSCLEQKLQD